MPSHKEFYDAISNISIDADTLNLNTDQVESKLDTTTGLLTTLSADTAIIKADMANGVLSDVRDGSGNAITSTTFGATRRLDVNLSSAGTVGSTAPTSANLYAGSDGANLRAVSVDSSGRVNTNINGTVPISGTITASQSTASSLKGQAQILNSAGTLITYSESGTYGNPSVDVISVQNPQGTSATATTFTSTTASSVLVSASTSRKVLTVFNGGVGTLYISPTSTATTTSFQVRLASGDYWECPERQVTMAHRAVFDTAGTAYITSIS